MKKKCPYCGAIISADTYPITCIWCGAGFDSAHSAELSAPGNTTGGNGEIIGAHSLSVSPRNTPSKKPQPRLAMLQAGGAFLFSSFWLLGIAGLHLWLGATSRNISDVGLAALYFVPHVGIVAAATLAAILYCSCSGRGLHFKQIAGIWVLADIYGFALWAFTTQLVLQHDISSGWTAFIMLTQSLVGALLVFLAVG